jgi:hypothetical protein
MTNRREFLQIGVTATAWPIVAQAAHAAGIDALPPSTPLFGVVYDARLPDSVAFAQRSAALGVRTLAVEDGDMTRLWYDEVYPRWRQGPAALAGLTAHGPMFCFEELARDVRMRTVFRAEHRAASGILAHAIKGPASMLPAARAACGRAALGVAMAELVARCPTGRHEISTTTLEAGIATAAVEPFYTWLIAPAIRG